jgi:hypothetical protein
MAMFGEFFPKASNALASKAAWSDFDRLEKYKAKPVTARLKGAAQQLQHKVTGRLLLDTGSAQ